MHSYHTTTASAPYLTQIIVVSKTLGHTITFDTTNKNSPKIIVRFCINL